MEAETPEVPPPSVAQHRLAQLVLVLLVVAVESWCIWSVWWLEFNPDRPTHAASTEPWPRWGIHVAALLGMLVAVAELFVGTVMGVAYLGFSVCWAAFTPPARGKDPHDALDPDLFG